ncbi:serpin family protein [Amycolatopsis nigrescens]|uniref:serpin family protein n=1 Tax=Amycolatopsis nigrescens TaxID=381445 RepID=UPI000374E861|nr:serpin family protein [Amycolatopsis nigrescens]
MSEATGSERAHLNFSLALHREVAAGGGDSCFSPYSVASALGLVSRAARGSTADELIALLAGAVPDIAGQAELLRAAAELPEPASGEAPVLAVSNTLWVWDELPVEDGFRTELATWPAGQVATAPFGTDTEAARRKINEDVAETTRDLIPELLQPGTVQPDTVASIVNALYLKTAWTFRFPDGDTEPAEFHAPSGTRRVPTMHNSERLGYAAADGWQLVELPAAGGVQALILLPDQGLAAQESDVDAELVAGLLAAKRDTTVHLALPKIDLDLRSDLNDVLRRLGVRTMFTPAADLTGLTPDPRIEVSDVLHQAVLRIDEQGLEGAAATAVMMRLVSMPSGDPVSVRVDRPFLLLVRHAQSGAIYFLARVVEP